MKPTLEGSVFSKLREQSMLVGKCTKCGKRYVGWALSRPEHRKCPDCGVGLVVRNMTEKQQPDSATLMAAQTRGIAEWQDSLEETLPHFLL